ncbi:MAG: hypothetical protein EPN79_10835 [Burkholderiaceae bacterium]|nr:MAG: hypothetical protein EPN79_10835 [Burkholderiaceae bacterium]TBR76819.1 MAG: hypothetical protein EPN64_06240 [Burkholderiaceae bacterium]
MDTTAFDNFKACTEEAPKDSHKEAKTLREAIGNQTDDLIQGIRALGLKADNCDMAYQIESSIYNYVKLSNPGNPMFAQAESFGASVLNKAWGLSESPKP